MPTTVDELLDMTFPEQMWVWEGILPQGVYAFLFGSRRTGKTHLVLDLAIRIASGQPDFLGRRILRRGSVVYCSLEQGNRYLQRLCKSHPLVGKGVPIVFETRLSLRRESDWLAFERLCTGRVLCVIDPRGRVDWPVKSNDPDAVSKVTSRLDFIASKTGCTILLVGHRNKYDYKQKSFGDEETEKDSFGGAGPWADLSAVHMEMFRKRKNGTPAKLVVYEGKESEERVIDLKTDSDSDFWWTLAPGSGGPRTKSAPELKPLNPLFPRGTGP